MNNQNVPLMLVFFCALLFTGIDGSAFAQESNSRPKVRLEYQNAANMPNHIPFKSVIYWLNGRAERDIDSTIRIIQKQFGETSEAEAVAILDRVGQTIALLEQDNHAIRQKLLCGRGSIQSKDVYYQRLDALTDVRMANTARHYVAFMAELNERQSEAFNAFLESKKETMQFRILEFKSSYENSGYDVRDVVTQVCAEYGVGL